MILGTFALIWFVRSFILRSVLNYLNGIECVDYLTVSDVDYLTVLNLFTEIRYCGTDIASIESFWSC
jgi:hypothetical protein